MIMRLSGNRSCWGRTSSEYFTDVAKAKKFEGVNEICSKLPGFIYEASIGTPLGSLMIMLFMSMAC